MRTGTARIVTPTVCLPCKKDYCPPQCAHFDIMQEAMNAAKEKRDEAKKPEETTDWRPASA